MFSVAQITELSETLEMVTLDSEQRLLEVETAEVKQT